MIIFGDSGTNSLTYKSHSAFPNFNIKVELNVPSSFPSVADEFIWWGSLFSADSLSETHTHLFARDEDNNSIPDENQIVKIYRYNSAQPENPLVVDPDDFAGAEYEAFIRDVQKSIAKAYYASVVGGAYARYAAAGELSRCAEAPRAKYLNAFAKFCLH